MTTTMKHSSFALAAVMAAATAALLSACASPGQAITADAQARAIAVRPAAPASDEWPDPSNAKWKQGAFPNLENVRKMAPGMGKDQVRELLGWPHFTEGLWGVREWNYLFHLRTGTGPEFKTCQYMVRYDDTPVATGAWWKTPECAALAGPPAAALAALPAAAAAQPPQNITLSADGLFRFSGARLEDLLPQGRARIERIADDIKSNASTLQTVQVVGHTDRLGTDASNAALSISRAETVKELLVRKGLDAQKISATGMGARHPLSKNCIGTAATPDLVACLQEDRRVEIQVSGSRARQ